MNDAIAFRDTPEYRRAVRAAMRENARRRFESAALDSAAAEVANLRGRAQDFRYFARRSRALGRRAEMFDSLRAAALCTVAALRLQAWLMQEVAR
jgi:hypothetical protein